MPCSKSYRASVSSLKTTSLVNEETASWRRWRHSQRHDALELISARLIAVQVVTDPINGQVQSGIQADLRDPADDVARPLVI